MTTDADTRVENTVSDAAMRRLTLTRMLIWAAREAREIECVSSAEHLDRALGSIADCIRDGSSLRRF
ncbi:hypothetical protein FDP22_08230 [Paroceanicella profunda]|uniref:Uncharacterized protein n=1 Tax=Paroceanicella profunda TaxID=2579971 RepID=A0A5B8FH46_9RHOB|nr:hypothetical protein [Paroceanicella profunda]QDL91767.1 hypothetical protein FDP22_08230 [Paroceanicella profunda]